MFKKLTLAFAIAMIALTSAVFAQSDKPKQSLAFTAQYNRENVKVETATGERFAWDAARDSVGGGVSWDYHPGSTAFFVGMQGGVTFHNKQLEDVVIQIPGGTLSSIGKVSKVAKGFFDYRMGIADRTGTFQPWIAGTVGIKNGNFGGITFGPTGSVTARRGSSFTYGGTGGVDLCGGDKKTKCLRLGVAATKAFNRDTDGWDVTPQVGFVIKF